jgi:hypothetical protein
MEGLGIADGCALCPERREQLAEILLLIIEIDRLDAKRKWGDEILLAVVDEDGFLRADFAGDAMLPRISLVLLCRRRLLRRPLLDRRARVARGSS